MKKLYINKDCVIVGNRIENKFFIFNRQSKQSYDINESMFDFILTFVNADEDWLNQVDNQSIISQLYDLQILVELKNENQLNNIKQIKDYNCARLFIELTNKCNLNCKHCYGDFSSKGENHLDLNSLLAFMDNCANNGCYQMDFTGGEPMLYPHLKEILEFAYKKGILVRIFTNLTLLTTNMLDLIKTYGVKEIVTSVDSCHSSCHNEFRGVEGCFDKTIKAINQLKEANIPVCVNTMIGAHNADYIDELVKFIDDLNVKSVLDVIVPEGRGENLNSSIKQSAKIIKQIYENHYKIIDKSAISVHCGIGSRFVYVKSDGNIYLCPSLIKEKYLLGNISTDSALSVWTRLSDSSNMDCKHRTSACQKCSGGCRVRACNLHGTMDDRDDVYCIINGIEVADD